MNTCLIAKTISEQVGVWRFACTNVYLVLHQLSVKHSVRSGSMVDEQLKYHCILETNFHKQECMMACWTTVRGLLSNHDLYHGGANYGIA